MNRNLYRAGTPALKYRHLNWIGESALASMQSVLADLLALSPSFYIQGGVVSTAPSGADTIYSITAGHVVIQGEPMPLLAGNIVKAPTQEVYLVVEDIPGDVAPVTNLDGEQDNVLRVRRAKLATGGFVPGDAMALTAPRKEALDALRYKGRLVAKGAIMPYAGTMEHFNGTGLGLANTPLEGWAVCNGLNGTVDLRGMVPMMATSVPSSGAGSLATQVGGASDPGDIVGQDMKQLTADQLPQHAHIYQDSQVGGTGGDVAGGGGGYQRPDEARSTAFNITEHDAVDMRQASKALVFIQSII